MSERIPKPEIHPIHPAKEVGKGKILSAETLSKKSEAPPSSLEQEFGSWFSIRPEELKKIEGYENLSDGRKLLVLENLKQATYGRIQEEADQKYRADTAQSKFLGRLWRGISKKYQIAKLEKKTAAEFEKGGMETHGEVLKQLVLGAQDGPEAIRTEDGKIEIQFVTAEGLSAQFRADGEPKGISPYGQTVINEFRAIAREYGKLPYEWSLETASKKEQQQFKTGREKFERARSDFLRIFEKRKESVRKYALDVEKKLVLNQFLNTHPDVEKQLQKTKSQSAWTSILKDTVTERGLYFAGGFAARSAAMSVLGFIGAPVAAAAISGIRSYQRGKETIKEEKKAGRRGKTKTEIIKTKGGEIERKSRDFVDVKNLNQRLEKLTQRIASDKAAAIDIKNLNRLVEYAAQRLNRGQINFGEAKDRILNQTALIKNLSDAAARTASEKHSLDARVEKAIGLRQQKISQKEKEYISREVKKGVLLGAGFAVAGWLARHFAEGIEIPQAPSQEITPPGPHRLTMEEMPLAPKPPEKVLEETRVFSHGEPRSWETETPLPKEPLKISPDTIPPEELVVQKPPEAFIEVAQKGDSVWKLAERQLIAHYGDKFTDLSEGRKTFLIDSIKDKIAANPEKFGLTDPDQINIGQEVNFSGIFEEKSEINNIFGRAESLEETAVSNIERNNDLIEEWVRKHPEEPLTSKRVEEILTSKTIKAAALGDEAVSKQGLEIPPPQDAFSAEEIRLFGSVEEAHAAKTFGFIPDEYRALRDITIGKLLEEIPSRFEPLDWSYSKGKMNLPLHLYGPAFLEKLVRLSSFARETIGPFSNNMKELTISHFLKGTWPEK